MLLHLVDASGEDPVAAYETVREELAAYGHGLEKKAEVVALSKCDAVAAEEIKAIGADLAKAAGRPVLTLSAATGKGVREVLSRLIQIMDRQREDEARAQEGAWQP